nr:hypothetical protein [Tanacetum cinerariifolium]
MRIRENLELRNHSESFRKLKQRLINHFHNPEQIILKMNSNEDELVLKPHKNWYKACRFEIEVFLALLTETSLGFFVLRHASRFLYQLLTPPPCVDPLAPEVIAPIADVADDSTGSPSLTEVDQDAPSSSNSLT